MYDPVDNSHEILDALADLATEAGWSREDFAVAIARGLGELVRLNCTTQDEIDLALNSLISIMRCGAMDKPHAQSTGLWIN